MNPTPTAAPARWPFREHRTMEQVFADEARGCLCELVEELGDAVDCAFAASFAEGEIFEQGLAGE